MLRPSVALTARAVWWRRRASAILLVVATVTTTAAALGPLYARAASESTFTDRLAAAPVIRTSLSFATTTDVSPASTLETARQQVPAPGSLLGYPTATAAVRLLTSAAVLGVPGGKVVTQVVWRDGECGHLSLVAGRCPTEPTDVLVSDRTVTGGYGWRLGSRLVAAAVTADLAGPEGTIAEPVILTVVGVYRPRDQAEAFWGGSHYFNAHLFSGRDEGPDTVDAVFVDLGLFPRLSAPTTGEVTLDYPVDTGQLRMGNADQVRAEVEELGSRYGSLSSVQMSTDILAVLDEGGHELDLLGVSTILVALQLALLAWLVLFQVVADAAEARGNEIALAKLRGLGPAATVRFGLSESMLLLALAVPLGLALSYLVVTLMAHQLLAPGTPVTLTLPGLLGALAGFAGGAVAAALAARRVLTRPVLEQWRGVPQDRPPSVAGLVMDLVIAASAVLGFVALHRGTSPAYQPRAVSLLAPGLLVLAVALLGVRLLPYVGRMWLSPTRASTRVGAFLAVRQVVRRPAGLRLAALLAVAIGLATFAVEGEAVAMGNRATRASLEVGATKVVLAQYQLGHDPVAIARAVDPSATWALAAATWLPSGGTVTGTVLAVDTSRLAQVANWPDGPVSASSAAALAGPSVPPPVVLRSTSVRVRITQLLHRSGLPPDVTLRVRPTGRAVVQVRSGPLRPGTAEYPVDLPCAGGCTLVSIVLDRPIDTLVEMAGTVRYEQLEQLAKGAWVPVPAQLDTAAAWRSAGPAATHDVLTAGPDGLVDAFSSTSGTSSAIAHVGSPVLMPILATPAGLVREAAAGPQVIADATGATAPLREVATVPMLPVALDNGVLADVSFLRDQLPDFENEANWQVWLRPSAPPDAVERLTAAGLLVQSVHTQAQRQTLLARQGPALALLLLVACAVAGTILAAGATALALAVTGRRRSFELAALRAGGVSRRSLLQSCVGEQLILLGTGVVLGLPAGIVAAWLTLGAVPEYSDSTPIPLDLSPHLLVLAVFAVVVVVLLMVTAIVAGRMLMRATVPARLREAAE